MSFDSDKRSLEKAAANGDVDAQNRIAVMARRGGTGRHHYHIGEWVVIDGIRTSYRGILRGVYEWPSGDCILQMHPCFALEALADTKGEVKIASSMDAPFDIYSGAILGIGRQRDDWPRLEA